jgi:DEP domain-containing protein 5
VEIYHPEDDIEKDQKCRLLLQVSLVKDSQGRLDYISVESSIALTFNLKNYGDVYMQKVDPASVALDSVEM